MKSVITNTDTQNFNFNLKKIISILIYTYITYIYFINLLSLWVAFVFKYTIDTFIFSCMGIYLLTMIVLNYFKWLRLCFGHRVTNGTSIYHYSQFWEQKVIKNGFCTNQRYFDYYQVVYTKELYLSLYYCILYTVIHVRMLTLHEHLSNILLHLYLLKMYYTVVHVIIKYRNKQNSLGAFWK